MKRGSFKNFFIPYSFFQILYRRVNFQIHPEGGVSISVSPLISKVPQRGKVLLEGGKSSKGGCEWNEMESPNLRYEGRVCECVYVDCFISFVCEM